MKAKKKQEKKKGQKLKLNEARIAKIAELVAKGIPKKYSCIQAGVSESSLYAYLDQAQALYDEKGNLVKKEKDLTGSERLMLELSESLKRAEADAIGRNVTMIQTASINNWQAAAWWLERRHPEEFGRRDRVEATVHGHMTYEDRIKQRRKERGLDDVSFVPGTPPKEDPRRSLNLAESVDDVESISKSEPKKKSFLERVKEDK